MHAALLVKQQVEDAFEVDNNQLHTQVCKELSCNYFELDIYQHNSNFNSNSSVCIIIKSVILEKSTEM